MAEDLAIPTPEQATVMQHTLTASNASDVDATPVHVSRFGVIVHGIPFNWPGPSYRRYDGVESMIEVVDYLSVVFPHDLSWELVHKWHDSRPERWLWRTVDRGWIDVGTTLEPLKGEERKTADRALKVLDHHRESRGGWRSTEGFADAWEALAAVKVVIDEYPGIPSQADVAERLWSDDEAAVKDDRAVRRLFRDLITPTTNLRWSDVKHGRRS